MIKKKIICYMLFFAMSLLCFTGCGENENGAHPLSYDDQIHPDLDNAYIKELFYRNDLENGCADPCVIQITDPESTEYGYYYLYSTDNNESGYRALRNKDITDDDGWEDLTAVVTEHSLFTEEGDFGYRNWCFWAPDVSYDPETDKYYMFYYTLYIFFFQQVL